MGKKEGRSGEEGGDEAGKHERRRRRAIRILAALPEVLPVNAGMQHHDLVVYHRGDRQAAKDLADHVEDRFLVLLLALLGKAVHDTHVFVLVVAAVQVDVVWERARQSKQHA